jgi:hypothetical protein
MIYCFIGMEILTEVPKEKYCAIKKAIEGIGG